MDPISIKMFAVAICSLLTAVCVFHLCKYFNIDEKDMVKRLLAVKSHEHKDLSSSASFTTQKSNFRFTILSKFFRDTRYTDKLKSLLEQAGIDLQVDTFIILSIIPAIIPLVIGIFVPAFAILCPVVLFLPLVFVKAKIKKRTMLFTQQLPDALDLLCNALRAGHSLFSAFEVIVKEMPNPINKVFKIMTDEIALGIDVKEAMKSLQETMPNSVDLRFFTTVVVLQREIGGNLIKLLEVLAATIRERFKIMGQLKAQTAQAKLSGIIVSAIPPLICIVLFFMAPEYMDYLIHHMWGKIALGVAIMLMIIGFIAIKKITDIEI